MSSSVVLKDVVEVFSIIAENIQLSGAIVSQKDGLAVASGIVKFGNGKKMAFSSGPDEIAVLSKRQCESGKIHPRSMEIIAINHS